MAGFGNALRTYNVITKTCLTAHPITKTSTRILQPAPLSWRPFEFSILIAAFELEVACSSKHARRQWPLANEINLANDFEVL
jgi:hypothetical protein